MNSKKAKQLRRFIEDKFASLSPTPTYNITQAEMNGKQQTIYLTTDCQRFFYNRFKKRI